MSRKIGIIGMGHVGSTVAHGLIAQGAFDDYVLINPKVISYSEEMIYAGEGEGCLRVNRDFEGIVPRHARITVEAYDLDGNKHKYRVIIEKRFHLIRDKEEPYGIKRI